MLKHATQLHSSSKNGGRDTRKRLADIEQLLAQELRGCPPASGKLDISAQESRVQAYQSALSRFMDEFPVFQSFLSRTLSEYETLFKYAKEYVMSSFGATVCPVKTQGIKLTLLCSSRIYRTKLDATQDLRSQLYLHHQQHDIEISRLQVEHQDEMNRIHKVDTGIFWPILKNYAPSLGPSRVDGCGKRSCWGLCALLCSHGQNLFVPS